MKQQNAKTKISSQKVTIVAFDLRATNAQITSTCSVKESGTKEHLPSPKFQPLEIA